MIRTRIGYLIDVNSMDFTCTVLYDDNESPKKSESVLFSSNIPQTNKNISLYLPDFTGMDSEGKTRKSYTVGDAIQMGMPKVLVLSEEFDGGSRFECIISYLYDSFSNASNIHKENVVLEKHSSGNVKHIDVDGSYTFYHPSGSFLTLGSVPNTTATAMTGWTNTPDKHKTAPMSKSIFANPDPKTFVDNNKSEFYFQHWTGASITINAEGKLEIYTPNDFDIKVGGGTSNTNGGKHIPNNILNEIPALPCNKSEFVSGDNNELIKGSSSESVDTNKKSEIKGSYIIKCGDFVKIESDASVSVSANNVYIDSLNEVGVRSGASSVNIVAKCGVNITGEASVTVNSLNPLSSVSVMSQGQATVWALNMTAITSSGVLNTTSIGNSYFISMGDIWTTAMKSVNIFAVTGAKIFSLFGSLVTFSGKNTSILAQGPVTVNASTISLYGLGAGINLPIWDGVITGRSLCHFTGNPHFDSSRSVTASP